MLVFLSCLYLILFLPCHKGCAQLPAIDSPNNMGNDNQNTLHQTGPFAFPPVSFILVRHGQTDWSFDDLEKGPQDLDLNEQGINTVLKTAQTLASKDRSVVIISSPKLRTIHTAQILKTAIAGDIIVENGIDAQYYGDFSKHRNLAKASKDAYLTGKTLRLPDDAEPDDLFIKRVRTTIIQQLSNPDYKKKLIIFVTHGEVFHYLTKALTGQAMKIEKGTAYLFLPPSSEVNPNWVVFRQE